MDVSPQHMGHTDLWLHQFLLYAVQTDNMLSLCAPVLLFELMYAFSAVACATC